MTTPTPAELRELAELVASNGITRARNRAKYVNALRACADLIEQHYEPCIPPHCPTCECCAGKTGGDDASDSKRWRELVDTWGGMLKRPGHMEIGVSTPRWRVPLGVETFGEAFDRRYEMDDAEREGANTQVQP